MTKDDPIDIHTGIVQASDELAGVIREGGYSLVILDPLAMFVGFTEINSNSEGYEKMIPLINAVRETTAHLMIVHHSGKTEGRGIRNLLGGTALAGSVDAVFLMERDPHNHVWIHTDGPQRYGIELPKTRLHYDPQTHWITAEAVTPNTPQKDLRGEILRFLLDENRKCMTGEIEKGTHRDARHLLPLMADQGVIKRQQGKGTTQWYWHPESDVEMAEVADVSLPVQSSHEPESVEMAELADTLLSVRPIHVGESDAPSNGSATSTPFYPGPKVDWDKLGISLDQ